ncbi:MAG: FAD-binding domain-containing protein [Planctomycetota bacterium]
MHVVWFKRDLRVSDHAPLVQAAKAGPCLGLYVYEPELIGSPEFDASHLDFINQSLRQLADTLRRFGGQLALRVGSVVEVLDRLHHEHGITALYAHEETGNGITFDRDRAVIRWARQNQIPFHEQVQNGVVRRLRDRDGWAARRAQVMATALLPVPDKIIAPAGVEAGRIHTAEDLGLPPTRKTKLQVGGEQEALRTLREFLQERGEPYVHGMSSPVTAWSACSRLSPYLAWGNVSMKRVEQQVAARQRELRHRKRRRVGVQGWLSSLNAYRSRLSWHCHFMQKLEDEPRIEFENMNRAYDGLREDEFNPSHFEAWCQGQTGYPLVDACMRALHQHSWINFRMRAMLVSFASYHLWLHWRPTAVYLAQHFLDFEPGIHFSQFQMQSGTTGINALRIYSPIKQVADQDPEGLFIRSQIPQLANVPVEFIAEPHKMPISTQSLVGCVIGKDYPAPIVDHAAAYGAARLRMGVARRKADARAESRRVVQRHGSRRRSARR